MCFSAEASFGVGALLLPAGYYCLHQALRQGPSYLPLAIIPLVFSIQQFAEGLVWIGIRHEQPTLRTAAGLVFLFFALGFWPFWASFCGLFLERDRSRQAGLVLGALLGLTFSGFLYLPLAWDPERWLQIGVRYHSIQYDFRRLPVFDVLPQPWWHFSYLVLVSIPLLRSPDRRWTVYGIMVVGAAAFSQVVFWYAYISVWCFFAALLSKQLCYIFYRLEGRQGDALARNILLMGHR